MAGCASLGVFNWKWLARLAVLIFVFFVFLVIVSLVIPGHHSGSDREFIHVKSTMKDIQVSFGHFRTEYNRYPVPDKESNPSGIRFVDLPMALDRKNGLTGMNENDQTIPVNTTLIDPSGERLYLLIEDDGDGFNRIPDPARRLDVNFKVRGKECAAEFLNSTFIIFSSCPDRDPNS